MDAFNKRILTRLWTDYVDNKLRRVHNSCSWRLCSLRFKGSYSCSELSNSLRFLTRHHLIRKSGDLLWFLVDLIFNNFKSIIIRMNLQGLNILEKEWGLTKDIDVDERQRHEIEKKSKDSRDRFVHDFLEAANEKWQTAVPFPRKQLIFFIEVHMILLLEHLSSNLCLLE